jgi:hypothetical protein
MNKFVLIVCSLMLITTAKAAEYYWIGGAGNWSDISHWSLSSGGPANAASLPGSTDVAIFDANSGGGSTAVDVPVAVSGLRLRAGYPGKVNGSNQNISVGTSNLELQSGDLILPGAGYLFTISGSLSISGGAMIHNNGVVKFTGSGKTILPGNAIFHDVIVNTSLGLNQFFVVAGTSESAPWKIDGNLTIETVDVIRFGTTTVGGNLTINNVGRSLTDEIALHGNLFSTDPVFGGDLGITFSGSGPQDVTLAGAAPGIMVNKPSSSVLNFTNGTDLLFPSSFSISHISGIVKGGYKNGVATDNYISSATYTGLGKTFTPGNLRFGDVVINTSMGLNNFLTVANTSAASPWLIEGNLTVETVDVAGFGNTIVHGNMVVNNVARSLKDNIELRGNFVCMDNTIEGDMFLNLTGTSSQSVTLAGNVSPGIIVNKPNGSSVHFTNGTDLIFPGSFSISHIAGVVTGGMRNGIPINNYINSATYESNGKNFRPGGLTFGSVIISTPLTMNKFFDVSGTSPAAPWRIEGDLTIQTVDLARFGNTFVGGNLIIHEVARGINHSLELQGDLISHDTYFSGAINISLTNSLPQNVTLAGNVCPGVTINKPSGSIVHFTNGTDLIFPGSFDITHVQGTVTGGRRNGIETDNYISSAHFIGLGKGFNPGDLVFGDVTVDITPTNTGDLTVNNSPGKSWIIENNLRVILANDVVLQNTSIGGDLIIDQVDNRMSGSIALGGDLVSADATGDGPLSITLNGTGDQNITADQADLPDGLLTINKPSGKVILTSDLILNGTTQDFFVQAGSLDLNHYNILLQDVFTLKAGATLIRNYCETISSAGGPAKVIYESGSTVVGCGSPFVFTGSATSISSNGAVIHGVVNPNSIATNSWFEYSTDQLLVGSTSTAVQSLSAGINNHAYSHALTGLAANTLYYYRIVAENTAGISYGEIKSFTTLPGCESLSITVSQINVDCNGNSTGSATAAATGGTPGYNYKWIKKLVLQPNSADGKDALLHGLSSEANTNYGSLQFMPSFAWTFGGTPGVGRNLIWFDLSSIPASAVITDAKLSLYAWDGTSEQHSTLSGSNATLLRRVTSPWNENTVTWSSQPTTTSVNQVLLPASTSLTENYTGMNITHLVNDMIANPNYGLMLQLQNESYYRRMTFASSDHPNPALRPKLEVTYALSNTSSIAGLPAGTYTVSVTDANNCTAETQVTITEPPALTASAVSGTISCHGGTTTVNVTANGGSGPYTGTGVFNVGAGTHQFTVTDANGCAAQALVTITAPTALIVTAVATPINCFGGSSIVNISATGGTAPYTGTGSFTVGAGSHTFNVTDANGCSSQTSVSITQPLQLTATAITMSPNPTVAGQLMNTIYLGFGTQTPRLKSGTITGGVPPYTRTWSSSTSMGILYHSPDSIIVNPSVTTTYTLTISDNAGCTITRQFTVDVIDVTAGNNGNLITVCHNGSSLNVGVNAVMQHLGHGDVLAICITAGVTSKQISEPLPEVHSSSTRLQAWPNPSNTIFKVYVSSRSSQTPIQLRVTDGLGRVVEIRNDITPGIMIQLGENYSRGIYILEMLQGGERKHVKLVKH